MAQQKNERTRQKAEQKRQKRIKVTASESPIHAPNTKGSQPPPVAKPHLQGWLLGRAKSLLIWAGVFASIVSGYALVRPSVTIEPDFVENEREPFSAYFRVQNTGFFSIHDVSFSCISTGGPLGNNETRGGAGQRDEEVISPGETATKGCSVGGVKFDGTATTVFSVTFRPKFWPWSISKAERFTAIQDARKIFHWTHQPLSN